MSDHERTVRQMEQARARQKERIRQALARDEGEPVPVRPTHRMDALRSAARQATEVTALDEALLARIRRDPELCQEIEAAASAWTVLAQYVRREGS